MLYTVVHAPGRYFLRKRAKSGANAPCQNSNAKNAPATQQTPPSIIFGGKRPGADLASQLSVGDGAASEASKGALYIGNFMPGMWVGTCFAHQ